MIRRPVLPVSHRPVVVLGFGRSGTTWLSDIVSRALGGLVLFEPLHPAACPRAEQWCYGTGESADLDGLEDHLEGALAGRNRSTWMLRNHLQVPFEEADPYFVQEIWERFPILGFKEIRANFMIEWLVEALDATVVYMVRHPCAVVSSILKRPNFWKDFTFFRGRDALPWHVDQFERRFGDRFPVVETLRSHPARAVETIAHLWGITQLRAMEQLREAGLPVFFYEDFIATPFTATAGLLDYIGYPDAPFHPTNVLTPSVMTKRKIAHFRFQSESAPTDDVSFFWKETLSREEVRAILDVAGAYGIDFYDDVGLRQRDDEHSIARRAS